MKKIWLEGWGISFLLFSLNLFAGNDLHPAGAAARGMGDIPANRGELFSALSGQSGLGYVKTIQAGLFAEQRFLLPGAVLTGAGAALPAGEGAFGLSALSWSFPGYREYKAGIAYGRPFGDNLMAGLQLDYLGTAISGYGTASAVTFEGGITGMVSSDLVMSVHFYNPFRTRLGVYRDERSPSVFRAGAWYRVSERLMAAASAEKDFDFPLSLHTGIECLAARGLFLRAGFSTAPVTHHAGAGLTAGNFSIDLAAVFHPVLGVTPHLSVVYSVKEKDDREGKR